MDELTRIGLFDPTHKWLLGLVVMQAGLGAYKVQDAIWRLAYVMFLFEPGCDFVNVLATQSLETSLRACGSAACVFRNRELGHRLL